jgi:hypothetical protein
MMSDSGSTKPPEWIRQVQQRGLASPLRLALDVLEPFGPLGAQIVWAAQPLLGVYFSRQTLHEIAETLEMPGGIERMRAWLEASP